MNQFICSQSKQIKERTWMLIRRNTAAASLWMLSVSNPNPSSHIRMKTASSESLPSSRSQNLPILSNPKMAFSPQRFTISKNLSTTNSVKNSIFISNSVLSSFTEEENNIDPESTLVVVSFYKFADFHDHTDLRAPLKHLCEQLRVSGGIILAPEGINGSICGIRESVEKVIGFIQSDERLKGLRQVETPVSTEEEAIHHGRTSSSPLAAGEDAPFRWDHVRVKLKKEIVSLGMPSVSPIERVGKYVSPKDWNSLISDPDTVVIDVRNDYETRIGKFKGAVDPNTTAFREFPSWVDDQYQPDQTEDQKQCNGSSGSIKRIEDKGAKVPPRVAMYCTGGIRCEKATSLLLGKGFKEVYHLEGGILKYLEEVPKTESLWEGECFVFDKRVSVEHGLVQGTFKLCYGCKQPVSDADMETSEWEYGVSCPYCYSSKSEEEKERARARQRQFEEWGVIGGPDKGHMPAKTVDGNEKTGSQMSKSV